MKRAVADRLQVSPASVSGYNLGEHGNSQFVAWSQVRVKGTRHYRSLLSKKSLTPSTTSPCAVVTVFLWQILYHFGIAAAAQRLASCWINDSHEEMPVSNYRPEYGTYLGYPAIVGRKGIIERLDLHLTEEEKKNCSIQPKLSRKIRKGLSMHKEEAGTKSQPLNFILAPLVNLIKLVN